MSAIMTGVQESMYDRVYTVGKAEEMRLNTDLPFEITEEQKNSKMKDIPWAHRKVYEATPISQVFLNTCKFVMNVTCFFLLIRLLVEGYKWRNPASHPWLDYLIIEMILCFTTVFVSTSQLH